MLRKLKNNIPEIWDKFRIAKKNPKRNLKFTIKHEGLTNSFNLMKR